MAKTLGQRGPIGAWAWEQRKALLQADLDRGIPRKASPWASAEKAQPEIERRAGHRMRSDYLRGIESGNQRPGPDTIAALERAYGSVAPPARQPEPEPATTDLSAILKQLSRIADALDRLVPLPAEHTHGAPAPVIAVPQLDALRHVAATLGREDAAAAGQRDRPAAKPPRAPRSRSGTT